MSEEVLPAIPAPSVSGGRGWKWCGVAAAALLAVGGVLAYRSGEGSVNKVRVTKHGMLPEGIVEAPDYMLRIHLRGEPATSVLTNGYSDAPIGNGLDFRPPEPLPLSDVVAIELLDADLLRDDVLDRVDVRERTCRGQAYEFELCGDEASGRKAGRAALVAGGALALAALILLARTHAA
jgi:hypothetical protein